MSSSTSPTGRIVALCLLAAAAGLATACSSSGDGGASPAASAATSPTQTGPTSPTQAAPTSPSQAVPGTCATAGLRVSKGASNGAAGTIFTNIDFTNISGSTCVLRGYPGVSLVSAGSNAGSQIGADAKRSRPTPVKSITLAGGQAAHAVLGVADAGNFPASRCHPITAHWLKVFPPDQTVAAYVPFSTQTCASTAQPTMTITAVSAGS